MRVENTETGNQQKKGRNEFEFGNLLDKVNGVKESEDCLPTERDPCHGAGCVKVVPWSIKYLQDQHNTVRSRLVH